MMEIMYKHDMIGATIQRLARLTVGLKTKSY